MNLKKWLIVGFATLITGLASQVSAHDSYFGTGLYLVKFEGTGIGSIRVCHNKYGKGKVGIAKNGKRYRIVHTKHGMRMATDFIGVVVFSKEGGWAKLSVRNGPKLKGRWAMVERECEG